MDYQNFRYKVLLYLLSPRQPLFVSFANLQVIRKVLESVKHSLKETKVWLNFFGKFSVRKVRASRSVHQVNSICQSSASTSVTRKL